MITLLKKVTVTTLVLTGLLAGCGGNEPAEMETVEPTSAFETGQWREGLTLTPHESINSIEFDRQYAANPQYWDKAFEFVKTNNLAELEPGRYVIDEGNVTAFISEGAAGTMDEIRWESHKNFTDLQYVFEGSVTMGIAPLAAGTVIEDYDPARDIMFYEAEGEFHTTEPGTFFLFFPTDIHRPNLKISDDIQVKRLLIKIRSI